jgi:hypothetical protein
MTTQTTLPLFIGTDKAKVIACLLQYDETDIQRGIPLKGRFTGVLYDWNDLIEIINKGAHKIFATVEKGRLYEMSALDRNGEFTLVPSSA